MAGEWTEMIWVVIPIDARDVFARLAIDIMPGTNEGEMFDDYRLSATGQEPATHLGVDCECTKELAHLWKKLLLPLASTPQDYPPVRDPAAKDVVDVTPVLLTTKFLVGITDRIDGTRLKDTKTVRIIDSRYSDIETISSFDDVLTRLSLVRIQPVRTKGEW